MKFLKINLLSLTLLLGLTVQIHADDIRSGLVSYYSFDSSTTADSVSTNNFTEVNAPTLGPGQRGTTAIQFNGSASNYLSMAHTASNAESGVPISAAGAYTIAMWVKAPGQTNKYLFTEGGTNSNNQLLLLQTVSSTALATNYGNDKFDALVRNDSNTGLLGHTVSSNAVFDDTWHHVAWVDDHGSVKLYVDGVQDAANFSYTPVGTFSFHRTAVGTLVRAAVATGNTLTGSIDDLGLWERALTQAEVQDVMNNGLPSPAGIAPTIVANLTNVTVASGASVQFSVKAIGARPFTYIWSRGGSVVPEATGSTYQIDNLTTADSGTTISVTVSNAYGGTVSETATVTVEDAPTITAPPQDVTVLTGDTITLSVTATGAEPLSYAWTRDGSPVGGNENPLVIANAQLSDGGQYRVTVSNSLGSAESDPAVVVVNPRPAPPSTIAIDFNNRANDTPDVTQEGFSSFILDGAGTAPTTRSLYNNSVEATVVGFQSSVDGRLRGTPLNTNDFTESSLLRDFVFAATIGANNGLDLGFKYLKPNQNYVITIWCFDQANNGNRESDWYANGTLAKQGYVFSGAILPTSNDQYQFTFVAQASASGELLIQGRQAAASIGVSVFLNAIRLVETDLGALPPTIKSGPDSLDTYIDAPVELSVDVGGTLPFTYVWTKNGETIPGATGPTLFIPNAQPGDAGDYQVTVSNLGGSTNSSIATVNITPRPPTPSTVRIDINNTGNETAAELEDGFESFALKAIGTGPTTRTLPSGIEITIGAAGGLPQLESRLRTTPTNENSFTEEKLLQDFVFSRDTNTLQGLDIDLSFLKPGQQYEVTIWSYDSTSGTTSRVSDWTANGESVQEGYSFLGSTTVNPTSNDQYRFSFVVAADSEGKISIQARKSALAPGDLNCFINALQLVEATSLRITDITLSGDVHLTIESPNPALPHRIDQTADIGNPIWTEVSGVTFTPSGGNVLQAQFIAPPANRFYRAVMIPPAALFEDDFEGVDKGWTSGGTGNPPWEKGTPAAGQGPGEAHSGTNVWAVGLTTQYSADSDLWLRSPTIDLTGATSATLEFWEFRSLDEPFGDTFLHYAAVLIKDASSGDVIAPLSKDGSTETQWTKRSFPLPPEALGKNVIIEFQLGSDEVPPPSDRDGWFIDDVTILPE